MKYLWVLSLFSVLGAGDVETFKYHIERDLNGQFIATLPDHDWNPYYTLDKDSNIIELKINQFEKDFYRFEFKSIDWVRKLKYLVGLDLSRNPNLIVHPFILDSLSNLVSFSVWGTETCNPKVRNYQSMKEQYTEKGWINYCVPPYRPLNYDSLGIDTLDRTDTSTVSIQTKHPPPQFESGCLLDDYNVKGARIDYLR